MPEMLDATPTETPPTPTDLPVRRKKPKYTYMLHDPSSMESLGKYVSTDYRYAALKVISRWHKHGLRRILLRRTNSKEIHEFEGSVVPLPQPKVIQRAGHEIVYHHKPDAKFVKAWVYEGVEAPEAPGTEGPQGAVPKPRVSKKSKTPAPPAPVESTPVTPVTAS